MMLAIGLSSQHDPGANLQCLRSTKIRKGEGCRKIIVQILWCGLKGNESAGMNPGLVGFSSGSCLVDIKLPRKHPGKVLISRVVW